MFLNTAYQINTCCFLLFVYHDPFSDFTTASVPIFILFSVDIDLRKRFQSIFSIFRKVLCRTPRNDEPWIKTSLISYSDVFCVICFFRSEKQTLDFIPSKKPKDKKFITSYFITNCKNKQTIH